MEASGTVYVMDHMAWPKKDRKTGKPIEGFDCQVQVSLGVGQPGVKLYVSEDKAKELANATGQSFDKKGRPPFTTYKARGQFELQTRSTTTEGSKYVNTNLVPVLRDIEPSTGRAAA